ncbi:MAG: hypothetical protein KDK78_07340 [Chlamydiia bacterium]|nr:hypothetical protein [Chlamydiia bacterium]
MGTVVRIVASLVVLAVLGYGAYWLSINGDFSRGILENTIDTGEFLTLEARFTPEEIMQAQAGNLLGDEAHKYLEPALHFFPFLLMEVKYSRSDRRTAEGMMLWSLQDGEMVINTDTWEMTHGFEDCITADATSNDFKVINSLATNGGAMDRDQLQRALHVEPDVLQPWLDSARRKHLIVQRGNVYRLHFADPKIQVNPQTKFTHWLVTKPYKHARRLPPKYSKAQVRRISEAAFGGDFAIRSEKEVYLPVYSIVVLNPDGTQLTSFWNALNGQPVNSLSLAN